MVEREKVVFDFLELKPERLGHEVQWLGNPQRVFRPQWLAMWGEGWVNEIRVHSQNQLVGIVPVDMFHSEMTVATLNELLEIAQNDPAKREAVALRIWESNKSTSARPNLLIPTITPGDPFKVMTAGQQSYVVVLGQSLA